MHLLLDADVYVPESLGVRHLLVAGEKVVWMGEERPPDGAAFGCEVVDLDGRRVVPGLIDGHVHPTGGGGEAGFASRVPPLPLSRYARAGTTTIIGVLGTDDVIRRTDDLVARTRALRAEGLSAWCLTGGYHVPPTTLTGSVRGDILHVDPILGVGEIAVSDHRSSQPTLEELLRIAADAHVAGLLASKAGIVQIHAGAGPRGLDLIRRALDGSELHPRTFHPTHMNRCAALFDEGLDLARRGGAIDVSAFPPPEDDSDELTVAQALARFRAAGVAADGITVSTDAGGSLPRFDAEGRVTGMGVGDPAALSGALADVLASGIALEEALLPFTRNVARLYGLSAKGWLGAGSDADLVVLDEADRPRDVMARGRWHLRGGDVIVRGTFEDQ